MRTVTVKSIIEHIKLVKNLEYSSFTTDAKILMLLNKAYRKLYLMIVGSAESYNIKISPIDIVNFEADLPTDFFRLLTVTDTFGNPYNLIEETTVVGFTRVNFPLTIPSRSFLLVQNKLKFPQTTSASNIKVTYIPQPEELYSEISSNSTGVLGNLTFTSVVTGATADEITVSFVTGGTAGAESVVVTDSDIEVIIEDGVSTSLQIKTALDSSVTASALITTAYDTSVVESIGSISLSGGLTDGTLSLMANEDDVLIADVAIALSKRSEEDYKEWTEDKREAIEIMMRYILPRNIGNNKKVNDVVSPYYDLHRSRGLL